MNIPMHERVYLDVPFAQKDQVRQQGAIFDTDRKKWWVWEKNPRIDTFQHWMPLDLSLQRRTLEERIEDEIEEVKQFAHDHGYPDDWVGRSVAQLRLIGPFEQRAIDRNTGVATTGSDSWMQDEFHQALVTHRRAINDLWLGYDGPGRPRNQAGNINFLAEWMPQ